VHTIDEESKWNEKNLAEIRKLSESGCVVVMVTHCLQGRVNMNVYNYGRDLMDAGVIGGEDMLPEVAFVKLAWLLGQYSTEQAKKMVAQNLRGEITASSQVEFGDFPD
jgi:glutamyl-tRNA(Gln) amidotransferase subunit D